MSLFNGFYTSLSGLNTSSQAINVTGNNIANVNTTGFKSSRAEFETQIAQSIRAGSAPSGDLGGTNPTQIGLGVRLSGVSRDFNDGSLQLTGVNTDLAVEGGGFFVVQSDGATAYTRAGNFQRNNQSFLTTADGAFVQGFGIDSNFKIVEGVVGNLSIPIGALTLAEATSQVTFTGNLDASGVIAVNGSHIESNQLYSDAGATTPAVLGDALTDLFDSGGLSLFNLGDVIHVRNATRGGALIPEKTFEVNTSDTTGSDVFGNTIDELMSFFQDILGIDASVSGGVTLDTGRIVVDGNAGTLNDVKLVENSIFVNDPTGLTPFTFDKTQDADGESIRTTFVMFDSLGSEQTIDLTMVLESTSDVGTMWRFYAQSEDDTDVATLLGSGTVTFDTNGQVLAVTDETVTMDRNGTGAETPQAVRLVFDDANLGLSALASSISQVSAISQDGSGIGSLEDFTVQSDGTVVGEFTNGLLRNLGRVVLATFVNPQGLNETSSNMFQATPSSGSASIVTPGTGSAGRVIGQALELSNVDITQEFINLVTASTGFSANSRVFSTSDRLIQELLATIR